jgi:hypothetical protein
MRDLGQLDVVAVALPSIARELDLGPDVLLW